MRNLQFTVNGQRLSKVGDFSNIVKGTKEYLKCNFTFEGNDWIGHKAVAIFSGNGKAEFATAIMSDGTCMVPNEVTDYTSFKLRLIGARDNSRITTNTVLISQEG